MGFYRVPASIAFLVFGLTLGYGYDRYGLDPSALSAYLFGGLVNGAVVYPVAVVVLLIWRRAQRSRPPSV